jgi:hypothetical protein
VAFGEERIDVACDEFKDILLKYMKRAEEPVDIGLYIKYKFFNNAHPENQTLRKQRRNDKYMEYYDGREWMQDSVEKIAVKIMQAFESEIIDMFAGFLGRDRYLTRDGERYMFLFRFMINIGFPFRFARLAAIIDDCGNDDMDYDVASQQEFRDGIIELIPTTVYNKGV